MGVYVLQFFGIKSPLTSIGATAVITSYINNQSIEESAFHSGILVRNDIYVLIASIACNRAPHMNE